MGYYADGGGSISFSRDLKKEESEKLLEIMHEVFCDVYFGGFRGGDSDHVEFYDGDKYYEDEVVSCLERIAREFPVESGALAYAGEDDTHWRFVYDASRAETESSSCWRAENGEVVFEGDERSVLVLEHFWDTEENEGNEVTVYDPRHRVLAQKEMCAQADRVSAEWRELCGGKDPWDPDYTWGNENEIHLGFQSKGPFPCSNVYSWEIYERKVL